MKQPVRQIMRKFCLLGILGSFATLTLAQNKPPAPTTEKTIEKATEKNTEKTTEALAKDPTEAPAKEGLFNKLLAPGPLLEGHKKLEATGCLECHSPRSGVPDAKCLACHKEINTLVLAKKGFHGRTKESCMECHADHKGRTHDTTFINEKTFDHAKTGYRLEGKHAQLKCADCHKEKRSSAHKTLRPDDLHYIGAQTSCVACHRKNDIHQFKGKWATKDCDSCHSLKSWKADLKFDHESDGHFKLIGKHDEIKCAACHIPKKDQPSRYQWSTLKQSKCLSCHLDIHKTNLSPKFRGANIGKCDSCHLQTTWKIPSFKHTITGYPLRGKHAEIKCLECHKQNAAIKEAKFFHWAGLKQDCLSCHKDVHRFGTFRSKKLGTLNKCLSCHLESSWKEIRGFDHNRDTHFVISGKHNGLECIKCHVPSSPAKMSPQIYSFPTLNQKNCELCHKNPHKGVQSKEFTKRKCSDCHVAEGWKFFKKDTANFDHNKATRFPLLGKHAQASCNACHVKNKEQIFKFEGFETQFCSSCHDNVHRGQFSKSMNQKSCAVCHTAQNFTSRLPFDHATTQFTLTGKHVGLECAKCHKATNEFFPGKDGHAKADFLFPEYAGQQYCQSCHKNVHIRQFDNKFASKACTDCHTTKNFTERLTFNHNTTDYPLRGKHADLQCIKCHTPTQEVFPTTGTQTGSPHTKQKFHFPELDAQDCKTCHKDPHKGNLGNKCSECHTEREWKVTRDFHRNFTLTGVHHSLTCSECHFGERRLGGMSQNCALCHQKDDIHNGSLPQCGNCHQQQFWENADFKHSMSRFPLRGVHRTLDCAECHQTGIYQGLQSRCVDCHRTDAENAGSPNHVFPQFESCNSCHNQFSFK